MKSNPIICMALFAILLSSSHLLAQDLVYSPKNPAFGGEVFNYQWMLNSANAQNTITAIEEDPFDPFNQSSVDDFADNLKRQLLNQISRELIGDQFGEGLSEGSYTIGSFQIEVAPTNEGLSISILDTTNGDQTLVVIPYF
jgi:curli production assembly/transport component CsgF